MPETIPTPMQYVDELTTSWQPTVRNGETIEDVPLSRWIGEALGAVSMCWHPRPYEQVFDSTEAARISDSLHSHVQRVIQEVINGTTKALAPEVGFRGPEHDEFI